MLWARKVGHLRSLLFHGYTKCFKVRERASLDQRVCFTQNYSREQPTWLEAFHVGIPLMEEGDLGAE